MGRRKKSSKKISKNVETSERVESLNSGEKIQSSISILDISLRLKLPLIPSGIDLSVDSDDDETLEFQIRPRFVFMSNLCLVCMNICGGICCEYCNMVSYCSDKHKNDDKLRHEKLCTALSDVCNGMEGFSLAKSLPPDLYRSFRIKTIDIIENKIKRKLDLWEREILLYPKICRVCKKINNDLICCSNCNIDFYCINHEVNHKKWCKDFQVFHKIIFMQHKHGFAEPDVPVVYYITPHVLPENFDFLIYSMYDNSAFYRRIDCYTYACLSLISTAPLTSLFAVQKTIGNWKKKDTIIIDIIGAEFTFECVSLRVWEKLFLHFLPNLKTLCLNFTGPELILPNIPIELLKRVKICRKCKSFNREIKINFNSKKLYHEIEDSRADLICLFNPGLYRKTGFDGNDTWLDTIKKFCSKKVPVVITSYTEFEIPRDIERIKTIANVEILLGPQKNPFAAVKPDRNFVSDDVVPLMYKNYCISIVRGL